MKSCCSVGGYKYFGKHATTVIRATFKTDVGISYEMSVKFYQGVTSQEILTFTVFPKSGNEILNLFYRI
jgi:hypothetical protein